MTGSVGGYGATGTPPGGACQITAQDLIGYVGTLWQEVNALKSQMAQLGGTNISAVYLSDISPDLGAILAGTLAPTVDIQTTQDYAMYAYSPTFLPSPIQVEGTITVVSNTYTPWSITMPEPQDRDIVFKVSKAGLYLVNVWATYAYQLQEPNAFSAVIILSGGDDIGTPNAGKFRLGSILGFAEGAALVGGGPTIISGAQGMNETGALVAPSGTSGMVLFRLQADDIVHVEVYPTLLNPRYAGHGIADDYLVVSDINVTVTRISDL